MGGNWSYEKLREVFCPRIYTETKTEPSAIPFFYFFVKIFITYKNYYNPISIPCYISTSVYPPCYAQNLCVCVCRLMHTWAREQFWVYFIRYYPPYFLRQGLSSAWNYPNTKGSTGQWALMIHLSLISSLLKLIGACCTWLYASSGDLTQVFML